MKERKPWQFKPGQSGNPKGRPAGSRHKTTLAAQALLDGDGEALTRKAIEMALAGDATVLRLCIERLVPVRREAPIKVQLPAVDSAADLPALLGAVLDAVGRGDITPGEAERLARLVGEFGRLVELAEIDTRLKALEERVDAQQR